MAGAAYVLLAPQVEYALLPYFQVRVEFQAGSGSGTDPAYISGLSLAGRMTIPESELLAPGRCRWTWPGTSAGSRAAATP